MLWCFANGYGLRLSPEDHWLWLAVLVLLVPAIHEVHFFCIHSLIHRGPLCRHIHSIHHNSINPGPWSSMSMHPVEAAHFFTRMMWHLVILSNPFVALLRLNSTAYGAIFGHIGFDKLELTEGRAMDSHAYTHCLRHQYFEVNCADGLLSLDRWSGTWHAGTKEGEARTKARPERRKARPKRG